LFSKFPFLRILLPFICGIIFAAKSTYYNILPLVLVLIFLLLLEKIKPSLRWKYRKRIGLLFQFYLFFLGFNCNTFQTKTYFDSKLDRQYIIHLVHLDNLGEKYDRYASEIYVEDDTHTIQHYKAYTYIASTLNDVGMGDIILTYKKPNLINTIYNPGSFNFAAFAKQNGFCYTLFLNNTNDWVKLKHEENRFLSILYHIRKWIITTLQCQLKNPLEAGLTEALLIGYKEDLDTRIQEQYTLTGVSHIIAVSGMHLGLIFSVLASIFSLLPRRRIARYLGFSIILPFLWVFALISGASASVLRSVMVFSIVLWGNVLLKKAGSINALFGSAFILLAIRPSYISDIGFQLSYAAVLSILIYEPFVSKWIYIKNKILKHVWSLVAITLAAQILTTPFVLFHFKQFPILFLITNMVAVPLSNLILLLAILLCLLSILLLPTQPIALIIHCCIKMMNGYIEKIANISFNSMQIQTSLAFTICLMLTIASLTYYLIDRKKRATLPVLVLVFLLSLIFRIEGYQLSQTKKVIALQIKDQTCIVHQHGQLGIIVVSASYITNKMLFRKQLRSLENDLGIKKWKVVALKDKPALIDLNKYSADKKMILLSGFTQFTPTLTQMMFRKEMPTQVIADGSTKLWKIKQWEKQAQEVHLRLHSTPERGAFLIPCDHR
jgi:competence protein ComEC